MASVKVFLRKEKINSKGLAPLYLLIIKNRRKKYVSLGQQIKVQYWDENKRIVKGGKNGNRDAQWLNNFIAHKIAEANQIALEMETKNVYQFNFRKVKERISGKNSEDFLAFAYELTDSFKRAGKYGTFRHHKSVLQKLQTFAGKEKLFFDEIDLQFLKSYERYLRSNLNNATNTINKNLKVIRKIFNLAIKEDLISYDKNPFLRIDFKSEPTVKKFLKEDELFAIEDLNLDNDSKLKLHRDLFVFAAYAQGLRISDVLKLKWLNFDGERLNIKVQKTGQMHSIKLPIKALRIIEQYKRNSPDKSGYIFPILRSGIEYNPQKLFNAIWSATAYVNKDLKIIARMSEIDSRGFSFHVSRHTFATQALKKGIRIEYVSKLLGHSDIKSTQIYAKIINEELEKAMEVFND